MGSFVAFSNDATTVRTVSGFADTVIYSLCDTTATDQFLTLLKPLATFVSFDRMIHNHQNTVLVVHCDL